MPKNAKIFHCEICDFVCSKQSNYNKHLLTRKHKILTNPNKKMPDDNTIYKCSCGKQYKHASSLCAHKKICDFREKIDDQKIEEMKINEEKKNIIKNEDNINEVEVDFKNIILTMMNENKELRTMLVDQQEHIKSQHEQLVIQQNYHNSQIKNIIPKIGNNTNNFNINMYLNNHCKDAMNITDFTRSIQISLDDFVKVGSDGYVNGISKIIVNAIKDLDVTKRPLHCSDAKRETLYIKENNSWEKDENKEKLNRAISTVGRKTLQYFPQWMKINPECNSSNTPENSEYHNIIEKTISQNTDENKKKIVKNIIKEVIIDK